MVIQTICANPDCGKSFQVAKETVRRKARIQWRSGRIDDQAAVRRMNEVRTAHGDNWRDDVLLARVYLEQGDAKSAVALLEETSATPPGVASLRALLEAARGFAHYSAPRVRTFARHTGPITSLSLSKDGRRILSGSWDKSIRLWDISSGRCIRVFVGHTEKVESVALSADGHFIISESSDRFIQLWSLDW
jgi:WD40 repeat protein